MPSRHPRSCPPANLAWLGTAAPLLTVSSNYLAVATFVLQHRMAQTQGKSTVGGLLKQQVLATAWSVTHGRVLVQQVLTAQQS